jgi:hypothetical protein
MLILNTGYLPASRARPSSGLGAERGDQVSHVYPCEKHRTTKSHAMSFRAGKDVSGYGLEDETLLNL